MNPRARCAPKVALRTLGVALVASAAADIAVTQTQRSTKVYAFIAHYTDTEANPRDPGKLHRVMQTVSAFYAEGSAGKHEFVGTVHPTPVLLPQARPMGQCRLPDAPALSVALRNAGIGLDGYHALAIVVPTSTQGCKGGVQTAFVHHDAAGTPRRVPLAVSWSITDRFIAHEIVHTHGLGHAKALVCKGASLAAADCVVHEYGNIWDLMGNGSFNMLSAPLRARMGWIEPVTHSYGRAAYTIGAATRPSGMPTAVQIPLPMKNSATMTVLQPPSLWVEYRAPFGFDTRMASPRFANFANGAMVNLTGAWRSTGGKRPEMVVCPPQSPCLLDLTPQTGTFYDAGLPVGAAWTEPFTGTQITVDSSTETTLTVTISLP